MPGNAPPRTAARVDPAGHAATSTPTPVSRAPAVDVDRLTANESSVGENVRDISENVLSGSTHACGLPNTL